MKITFKKALALYIGGFTICYEIVKGCSKCSGIQPSNKVGLSHYDVSKNCREKAWGLSPPAPYLQLGYISFRPQFFQTLALTVMSLVLALRLVLRRMDLRSVVSLSVYLVPPVLVSSFSCSTTIPRAEGLTVFPREPQPVRAMELTAMADRAAAVRRF